MKPPLPAVGGGDGVGRVLLVGDDVTKFRPGDLVKSINLIKKKQTSGVRVVGVWVF